MSDIGWADAESLAEAAEAKKIWRAIRDAIWEAQLDVTAKMVALRLVEHLPNVEPSLTSLARHTSLSERAVRDALRRLETYRVIITLPHPGRRSHYAFVGQPVTESTPAAGAPLDEPPRQLVPHTPAAGAPHTPAAGAPKADLNLKQASKERYPGEPLTDGIFDAPTIPAKPAASWEPPKGWRPKPVHSMRVAELKLDMEDIYRTFRHRDWNRSYSDWDKRFSLYIEEAKIRRDTEKHRNSKR